MTAAPSGPFESWAILELFGHRRLAGLVREVELFGGKMCRIDIPTEPPATQFYGSAAIYGLTITTEEAARAVVSRMPRYEMSALGLPAPAGGAAPTATSDSHYTPDGHEEDEDTGDPRECEDCGEDVESTDSDLCNECIATQKRIDDRMVALDPIEELIAASSLGTPEAVALRAQTPPVVVAAIVERSEALVCPHDCTHGYSERCPHDCNCARCEMPF